MPRSRRLSYIEAVNILDISNEESEYDESDLDYCAYNEFSEIESSEDESVEDNQVDIQQFIRNQVSLWVACPIVKKHELEIELILVKSLVRLLMLQVELMVVLFLLFFA